MPTSPSAALTESTFNLPFVIKRLLTNNLSVTEARDHALMLGQDARSILTTVISTSQNDLELRCALCTKDELLSSLMTAAALMETADLIVSVAEERANA